MRRDVTGSNRLPLYRALFQTAPDAMVVVDRGGRMVLVNPQCETLFGYAHGELAGEPVELLLPESAREAHRAHLQRYTSAPRVRPMGAGQELVGRRRDGTRFPVEIALSPVVTDEGDYFVASIRDVSSTQRERQALARAGFDAVVARLGQLALETDGSELIEQTVPDSIAAALQADAVALVFASPGAERMDLRASVGLDASTRTLVPWSTEPGNPLGRVLQEGRPLHLQDFEALGDELRPHAALYEGGFRSSMLVPLLDRSRPMGAIIVLWRRPSPHGRDALHLVQSVATLLASAVQRARSERQLAHSQRLDAIGQLTGGIAHDFNNLLTVISGSLQLLELHTDAGSEAVELIDDAQRAVARGAELTSKLLGFARGMKLSPRPLDPVEVLASLGKMMHRTLGEQVEVRIQHPDGMREVLADPGQLESALLNLAINARDAMPRGGRLTIALREQDIADNERPELRAGRYVVFAVTDTGLGMSAETLAHALEPFFTTKETGKGTGLGLSTVFGFARQSGGTLTLESALGFGTRAELWLPVAAADAVHAHAGSDTRDEGSDAGRGLILVVEDEPDVRRIASAFLRGVGYRVLEAGNAQEALQLLEANADIALLFTDIVLGPGANGRELAREAVQRRPGLRVLLTTGYESNAPVQGADDGWETVSKPYRRDDLAAAIQRTLRD